MSDSLPDFSEPALAKRIEALSPEAIDTLPFGVIRLDGEGRVAYFSEAERQLSGIGSLAKLGDNFFADIAPCMGTDAFRGRIERARKAGTLDIEFSHIGDYEDRDRELSIRAQSASDGGTWLFLRRET